MLDVCELTILSALNRKESRGPFYRTDYPYTDNVNWHARNILIPRSGQRRELPGRALRDAPPEARLRSQGLF